ncbi:MAG: gliding motility-associated C-terminal domain-containing protein, partial [Bacteroidales bacterium]|nr:gliding motility-associated C-terminal domain-containing protein [Bacteroidales bacterium]
VSYGGCSADSIVQITNRSVHAIANDVSDCDDIITLNGNDPSGFGSGLWTVVSGTGLVSTPTLYNSSIVGVSIGSSTTLQWFVTNGSCSDSTLIQAKNNDFVIFAGNNDTVCSDTAFLLSEAATPGTGVWSFLSGNATFDDISSNSTIVRDLARGPNVLQWEVTRGVCVSSDTVVIVNNTPTEALITAPVNTESCTGSVTLKGNHPNPYYANDQYWRQLSGSGMSGTVHTFNVVVNGLAPGNNVFVWRVQNGSCYSTDTITVINNRVFADAGLNDTVCSSFAFLNANNPLVVEPYQGVGHWNNLSGPQSWIDDTQSSNTQVHNLPSGTSSFQWTVSLGGCSADSIVQITNRSVIANASDVSDCNSTIGLNGNNPASFGGNGEWTILAGSGNVDVSTLYNTSILNVDYGGTTTLIWHVSNGVCDDDTLIQATNNSFLISAGSPDNVCGDTAVLLADPAAPGTGYWDYLSGNATFDNSTSNSTIVRDLAPGENILQWIVTRGACSNTGTVSVFNNSPSDAIITGPASTFTCSDSVTLRATTPVNFSNHYWTQISGGGLATNPTDYEVTVHGLDPGNNTFIWFVDNGVCSNSDTITITNNQVVSYPGFFDTICSNTTTLNSSDPLVVYPFQGSGYWTNLSGPQSWISNSTLTNTQVTGLNPGTNTFQWTVTKGSCVASDIVKITNLSVHAVASDVEDCSSTLAINGNDPGTFGGNGLWTILAGSGHITDSTLFSTTITGVSYEGTSTLQWLVSNGTCSDSTLIQVSNNNFLVSAGARDTVCVDTVQLNAQSPGLGTGQWGYLSGNANFDVPTNYQTIARDLSPGENILSWTVTRGGCSNTSNVTIVNNQPSVALITGPLNTESCNGSVSLTADIPTQGTGHWEQIAGSGLVGTPGAIPQVVNNLSVNNNIFLWVVEKGNCSDVDTIVIVNNQVIANAGSGDTICQDSIQLHAVDPGTTIYGGTGHWVNLSGGGVTIDDQFNAETYIYDVPNYSPITMQWIVNKGGCFDDDKINILNYSVSAIANNTQIVCDSFATITANAYMNPPEVGYWSTIDPAISFVDDPSNNVCDVDNLSSGFNQFVWHVSNTKCADSVEVFVTNYGFEVNANAGGPVASICKDIYTLSGDNPNPGTGFWAKISGPGVVSNSTLFNSTVVGLNSTPTILEWTVNKNGCSASDRVSIISNAVQAYAASPLTTCDGTVVLQGTNPSPGTGVWKKVVQSSSGDFDDPFVYNTEYSGIDKQTTVALKWVVTSSVGACKDSVQILVTNNDFNLNAGVSYSVCSDTAQLSADSQLPGTGYWQTVAGSGTFDNSTSNITVVRGVGANGNVYSWTVSKNGCDVTDSLTITNNSVIASAGFDQLGLCSGYATITGNDISLIGGTGFWEVVTGSGDITNSTNYFTTVTNLSRNANTLRWTVSADGCSNFDDVVLDNNSFDVEAGVPQTTCVDTAILNGVVVAGGVGQWTPQGGTPATVDIPSLYNSVVHGLQQGTNTFRWTVQRDGCEFFDEVVITNNRPDDPMLISTDDVICIDSIQLQAIAPEAGTNGKWSYTGSGGTIQNPNNNNTWAHDLNPGSTQFIWTVSRGACSLSDAFSVENQSATANAGGDQMGLCQDFASLNAVNPTAPAFGYWTKADAQSGMIDLSNQNVTDVTNLGYGSNKFVWNVTKGICGATDTVEIFNNSASPAEVGSVPSSCTGSVILSATPPSYSTENGLWTYTGGNPPHILDPTNPNTQVEDLEYGASLFTWTVTNTTAYATCYSDTSITVINNEFNITAGANQLNCDSISYLEAQTRPYATQQYWTVITGSPNIANSNNPNSQIIVDPGASTVLQWTVVENGCTDDTLVTIQNKEVFAIAYPDEVCNPTTTLSAVPPNSGENGYWSCTTTGIGYTPDNSTYNAVVNGLNEGSNLFTWHLENTVCSDSVTVDIKYTRPYADAGPSLDICEDTYIMSANNPASNGNTGVWSVKIGAGDFVNSTLFSTTVSNIGAGANTYVWTVTNSNGCSRSDEVIITNNKPEISVGVTQNICQNNTYLTGNNPGSNNGLWTKITPNPGTHTIVTPSLYNTQVTGMNTAGTYVFQWTVWNSSCTATEQLYVKNNSIIADAGSNITSLCVDSTRLAASLPPNTTGEWSTEEASVIIVNSTLFNTWVTNLNQADNLFTWTVSNGKCSSSDYVIVTNNTVFADAGDNQSICNSSTTLFGSNTGGGVGYWDIVNGDGTFVTPDSNTTIVTGIGNGVNTYSWTVTRGICEGYDEVVITNNQVYADAGAGEILCGTEAALNAFPPALGENGFWQVSGGSGYIANTTDYSTTVSNLARGENVLRWTVVSALCSASDTVTIKNVTPSQAVTAPNREICTNSTTITANTPAFGTGVWELVSGPVTVNIVNPNSNSTTVQNLGAGLNSFAWIITDNDYDCSTSDTIEILNSSVIAFAGEDADICTDTFKLQASLPDTNTSYGLWTKVSPYGVFDEPSDNNTVVRNMSKGTNTFRWTVYKGSKCSAFDEVRITNNSPTTADAGNDRISCDGNALLIGSTPDIDEAGLWQKISGGGTFTNPTMYWTGVVGLNNGANRFSWSISKGNCVSVDEIIVTNNKITVYAGETQRVCTDSVFLTGNEPQIGSGIWQLAGGSGNIQNSTNYQTAVTGLGAGVNTFKWIISETSCSNYDEVQVYNDEPTDAIVCDDTISICTDFTNLCANFPPDGENGYWTLIAGDGDIVNSTLTNTLVTNLTGESSFVWTIQKENCYKHDTLFIDNGALDAIVSTDTMRFCSSNGTLSANNPLVGHGFWTLISGTGVIANSTAYITDVTGLSIGNNTFRWTVVQGTCMASDDMTLVNDKFPVTANLAGDDTICTPETWVIGNPPSGGAIGFWTMSSGSGQFDNIFSPATRAYNIGNGNNTARWTIERNGCQNYAEFVIVNKTIIADATSPIVVCSQDEIASLVASDPGQGTGLWELISGNVTIGNSTSFSTTVSNVHFGSNSLRWTVSNGKCFDQVYVDVQNNFFSVTAGNDRTVCDTTTILNGTNPGANGSGSWTVSGGQGTFTNASTYNTRVNGLMQGLNRYTWTVTNGECSASDEVFITNGIPDAEGGGNQYPCVNYVTLNAEPPLYGSGTWALTGGSGNIITPSAPNTLVENLGVGQNTFRWTVANGQCLAYDDITIFNYTVNISAGDDQVVCDTFADLAATPPSANGSGYWTIIGGGGHFEDPTLFNTFVHGLHDGVNSFQWNVSQNGCTGNDIVVINNQNIINVYAGEDQTVLAPNTTLEGSVVQNTIGTWSITGGGGTFADPTDAGTYVDGLQYGVNTFAWTVVDINTGCSGSDDVDIVYNGFDPDAGPTQYICTDTTTLEAVDVIGAVTYWDIIQGYCLFENIEEPNTRIFNIESGHNILRWNVTKNGFTASDTVSIYNYMFSVNAGNDQHLCDDSTIISGSGPLNTIWTDDWSGQWIFTSGGGILGSQFAQTTQISNLAADTSIVKWIVTRNNYPGTGMCRATDNLLLIYHKVPQPTFITSPMSSAGCSPLGVTFINTTPTQDTVAGTQYLFNYAGQGQDDVPYDSVGFHVFYNSSDSTFATYTVTLTARIFIPSGQQCTNSVQNDVLVYPIANAQFIAQPVFTEYPFSNINIQNISTDTLTHNYAWDWGDGEGIVDDLYYPARSHSYETWGDYMIRLAVENDFGCHDVDSLLIRILAPIPTSGGDNTAAHCPPLRTQLYANVNYDTPGESEYKWVILDEASDDTLDVVYARDPLHTFSKEGVYLVDFYVTGAGTTPPFGSFIFIRRDTITIFPEPIASFTLLQDTVMAPDQPIHCYNNSVNADTCFWNFGLPNGSAVSYEREPIYYYQEEGDFYISLQITSNKGCVDDTVYQVPVTVLDGGDISFPNAFVPGPNSPNPVFLPALYEGVEEYELQIFNRWGEYIWVTTNINEGWDGTIDGDPAPQDAYVYKCRVVYENGVQETITGSVTLLR